MKVQILLEIYRVLIAIIGSASTAIVLSPENLQQRTIIMPRSLYEALPYLYLVAGILSLCANQSPLAFFSATLFWVAGWLVIHMRRNYRRQGLFRQNL